jgi:hypothetical protein
VRALTNGILAGLLLALIAASYFAIAWGVADFHAQRGYDEMTKWGVAGPDLTSWQYAFDEISHANVLAPIHPVYLQRLSRLHRMQITHGLVSPEEYQRVGDQSKMYLARSIEVRPRWGYTWAELAYVKWLLGEKDAGFLLALTNAVTYGPWETGVVNLVNFIGLREYERFDERHRQLVIDNIVRGLRSPVPRLFKDTFERIKDDERVKSRITIGLYPFLGEQRWRRSVRYNFFQLADWGWVALDGAQQVAVIDQTILVIRALSTPYAWVNNATNVEFKKALCESALVESPQDVNLKAWCG